MELFKVTTQTGIEAKFDSMKEAIKYTIFLEYLGVDNKIERIEEEGE